MEDLINEQIYENLYEEIYAELCQKYITLTEDEEIALVKVATRLTYERFEEQAQWLRDLIKSLNWLMHTTIT